MQAVLPPPNMTLINELLLQLFVLRNKSFPLLPAQLCTACLCFRLPGRLGCYVPISEQPQWGQDAQAEEFTEGPLSGVHQPHPGNPTTLTQSRAVTVKSIPETPTVSRPRVFGSDLFPLDRRETPWSLLCEVVTAWCRLERRLRSTASPSTTGSSTSHWTTTLRTQWSYSQ